MSRKRRTSKIKQPKPSPFTGEQIAARAYILWQSRSTSGKAGTEAGDWEAAKESLAVERALPKRLRSLWSPVPLNEAQKTALELHKLELMQAAEEQKTALELDKIQLERRKIWISAVGVLATFIAGLGLYSTYLTGQEQQRVAQQQLEGAQQERQLNNERLVTDRFAKAVEQLGSQGIDIRIGGIYSLERIAKDSSKDHWTIMEVLTAFVRNKTSLVTKKQAKSVEADVQSALTVIGRRKTENDRGFLDLSSTNLKGATLYSANLRNSYLKDTHLSGAQLDSANLANANLANANLTGAALTGADLTRATLTGATLAGANLTSVNFSYANLRSADLRGANLACAIFEFVSSMTTAQIKTAQYWEAAHYDREVLKALKIPPPTGVCARG